MLRECPTVAEEEQIPRGIFSIGIVTPIFPLRGDSPAKIETVTGRLAFKKMSPPLATYWAMAPATEAIGPTPTPLVASIISLTSEGA
jgi:hypothetical protein